MADSLKTRILVNLVGKPAVIIPALGSLIAFAGATVAQNPGMPVFAGILGLLATAGVVGYRFVFKMDEVREGVKEELKGERTQSRDATLDDLYRRLLGDNDPRTEEQLDALRKLDAGTKLGVTLADGRLVPPASLAVSQSWLAKSKAKGRK